MSVEVDQSMEATEARYRERMLTSDIPSRKKAKSQCGNIDWPEYVERIISSHSTEVSAVGSSEQAEQIADAATSLRDKIKELSGVNNPSDEELVELVGGINTFESIGWNMTETD